MIKKVLVSSDFLNCLYSTLEAYRRYLYSDLRSYHGDPPEDLLNKYENLLRTQFTLQDLIILTERE